MSSHRDPVDVLEQRLRRRIVRTIKEFGLIEEGDRVLVAVSGGKDSYGLLDLLTRIRARSPFPFELVAVHLDQVQPGYDGAPLAAWLADFTARTGVPSEIVQRDTYSIVKRLTKEGGTYCAPCSRLRRGILYDTAERLGCNKLALGHHRDDALETLLLNLFYSGKLQAMPAGYTTNDGRFEVIRPLVEVAEADLATYATLRGFPILPCNLCGSQAGLKREVMAGLLKRLEGEIPDVREVMLAAIKNVKPSHLLDPRLAARAVAEPGEDPVEALGGGCDGPAPTGEAVVTITG
ncbi:MAG: tRNA 2-thiocytidine(32) synthetase TtcA [bacterium]